MFCIKLPLKEKFKILKIFRNNSRRIFIYLWINLGEPHGLRKEVYWLHVYPLCPPPTIMHHPPSLPSPSPFVYCLHLEKLGRNRGNSVAFYSMVYFLQLKITLWIVYKNNMVKFCPYQSINSWDHIGQNYMDPWIKKYVSFTFYFLDASVQKWYLTSFWTLKCVIAANVK